MSPPSRPRLRALALAGGGLGWLVAACGSGGGGSAGVDAVDVAVGRLQPRPGGGAYVADEHQGGGASRLRLVEILWGRLVDVYGVDARGEPLERPFFRDYLIHETVFDVAGDWRLETNPITQTTRLVILREPEAPDRGDGSFETLLARARHALPGVQPKGLAATEAPPFPFVVRNAALSLRFDDLLDDDAESVQALPGWVRLLAGYPPLVPQEPRVLFDPNHGGVADGEFHSTRVLIDPTVSETEAADSPVPLALASLGLPRSDPFSQAPNVVLRVPTRPDPGTGRFTVLRTLRGRPLDPLASRPHDPESPTLDLVRALRSGNEQDPNNGFLLDFQAPSVVGAWPCNVEEARASGADGFAWRLRLRFLGPCRKAPAPGDIVRVGERFLETAAAAPAPDAEGAVELDVRLLNRTATAADELLGFAAYQTVFAAGLEVEKGCWVRFTPAARQPPATDVAPQATLTVRFSEPMDPDTALPFDSFLLVRGGENVPPSSATLVVGGVATSQDLRELTFTPRLPFAHQGERALFHLRLTEGGVNDLAGNALATPLPRVEFSIDPAAPEERNRSIVLRFDDPDELPPAGFFDVRGQVNYPFGRGTLRPREPIFAARGVDASNPLVGIMAPFPPGVATPISPLGSKLHAVWRYADLGWAIRDESKYDLDVVGLYWSPARGNVSADFYEQLEIRLAHSAHLPDEQRRSPQTGGMRYPDSGLKAGPVPYEQNLLSDPLSPQVLLRARAPYRIEPRNVSFSATGIPILAWPLDPPGRREPFVWRDTAVLAVGGNLGAGVPLDQEVGGPLYLENAIGSFAPPGHVPTVGLPLLMEFRCFPSETGIGLNPLAIVLASNASAAPNFRAYSTGGFDFLGQRVVKNPDLELFPTGGFNPGSRPPGRPTARTADNSLYLGQLDYVPRVSRAHTIWIDTRSDGFSRFAPPVLEPPDTARPDGTRIVVDFRGAERFDGSDNRPFNSQALTPYGEPSAGSIAFYRGDPTWKRDPAELDGTPYLQMRFSFFANVEAGLVAELSAVGVAYRIE